MIRFRFPGSCYFELGRSGGIVGLSLQNSSNGRFVELHQQFVKTFAKFNAAKTNAEKRHLLNALKNIVDGPAKQSPIKTTLGRP